jgi:hypothetical protein
MENTTVEVMIMSRYRYRPVTIPSPLQRYRDSPSATVTDRYAPFTTSVTSVTLIFLLNFKTHYITIGNACNACNASNGKIR